MILGSTIILILLGSILASQTILNKFQDWKTQFNKNYQSKYEEIYRFQVYNENFEIIQKHNLNNEYSYTLGENQFMDLTNEEFLEIYASKNYMEEISDSKINSDIILTNYTGKKVNLYDWSDYCMWPKDQGNCGAGWAFATAEIMECYLIIQSGSAYYRKLSQQQFIDCVDRNYGCETRSMDDIVNAFEYANEVHISELDYYPQTGKQDICKGTRGLQTFTITQFETIQNDKFTLVESLIYGPIVAGFDISGWQFYKDGTYDCFLDKKPNHHAIIVKALAFHDKEDKDYIEIQNSWGSNWGRSGSIKYSLKYNCNVYDRPIYRSFKVQVH
ncbi:unnamed protein product [Paramecium primaurelia]|uniref:Papain family cysteine protease n=1 Tax=Paramecium primaurelia TaxID=5886 RepID=A0A8S1LB56_PARPR|nr:unnamed protein product [Paramecium primaurelia]